MKKALLWGLFIAIIGIAIYISYHPSIVSQYVPELGKVMPIETVTQEDIDRQNPDKRGGITKDSEGKYPEGPKEKEVGILPMGENHDESAGAVEAMIKPLVIIESKYMDESAEKEIETVRNAVTSSTAWAQYSNYSDGRFAVPINAFNIRTDGIGGYLLDYWDGKFTVNISLDHDDIKNPHIYLMNKNRDEFEKFE